MLDIRVSLKNNSAITGTITRELGNGHVIVFWDGEHEGDFVHISELNGVEQQEIMAIVPDNCAYEFGIDRADDDAYYAVTNLKTTGKTKLVTVDKCSGCGREFPSAHLMNASLGLACPDCYDRMSG